jgi:uncharacterized membrane protein YdjX (TVP38/TMEM64 family)
VSSDRSVRRRSVQRRSNSEPVLLYPAAAFAPLPKNVLAAMAGLLFGLAVDIAVVFLAALLGALAAFALGRALGREAAERITGTRVAPVDAGCSRSSPSGWCPCFP